MMGIGGLVLVLAGVAAMAASKRIGATARGEDDSTGPLGLALFFAGCGVVAVGAVLITEWWLES